MFPCYAPVCTRQSRPLPLYLNYDSKRLTRFNPGDPPLNRVSIASNRPQTAFNLLSACLWFGVRPPANCQLLIASRLFSKTHSIHPSGLLYRKAFHPANQSRIRTRLDKHLSRSNIFFAPTKLVQHSPGPMKAPGLASMGRGSLGCVVEEAAAKR